MTGYYGSSLDKLISCYFTRANQLVDPTDPSKGETDNVIFTINEEFVGPEFVANHIGTAKGNDYFPAFGGILHDYGVIVQPLGNVFFSPNTPEVHAFREYLLERSPGFADHAGVGARS